MKEYGKLIELVQPRLEEKGLVFPRYDLIGDTQKICLETESPVTSLGISASLARFYMFPKTICSELVEEQKFRARVFGNHELKEMVGLWDHISEDFILFEHCKNTIKWNYHREGDTDEDSILAIYWRDYIKDKIKEIPIEELVEDIIKFFPRFN